VRKQVFPQNFRDHDKIFNNDKIFMYESILMEFIQFNFVRIDTMTMMLVGEWANMNKRAFSNEHEKKS
jgi:hypothetical protein